MSDTHPENRDRPERDGSTTEARSEAERGRGLLLIVSGPSGVGKTTLVGRLRERVDLVFSVSATTRAPGAREVDGRDYFFIDEPTFQQWIDEDRFLEFAQVFGRNWYGTPREPVDRELAAGRLVLLDIDVQGAEQVRARMPEAYGVFVLPPSEESLLARLRGRARDDEDAIARRYAEARREIERARGGTTYDDFVVNDDLDRAAEELVGLVRARL